MIPTIPAIAAQQPQNFEHGISPIVFAIAILLAVVWWAARSLVGKERGNELMIKGLFNVIKFVLLLPFRIIGFVIGIFREEKVK